MTQRVILDRGMASPLDRPQVAALLRATPYADVAVTTRTGPHITPAAFAAASGRLWVVSSRRTVRVRAIRRTGVASVLARHGERSVLVSGRAAVLSPWPPHEALAMAEGALPAARAASLYTLRNLRLVVAGFGADMLMGAVDPTLYDRVLVCVDAERGMLIDDDEVLDSWGRWRSGAGSSTTGPRRAAPLATTVPPLDDLLAGVPDVSRTALRRSDTAALGWLGPDGPVALPAQATLDGTAHLRVSSEALRLAGGDGARSDACLTLHDSDTLRPSGFRGVVLRGQGRVTRRGAARTGVALATDRVSWWSGFRAGTSRG